VAKRPRRSMPDFRRICMSASAPPGQVRRTLRISCEGRTTLPPRAMTAGRGVADHDASTRLRPPLVCCIRLFYSAVRIPTTSSSAVLGQGQIVRLIHDAALAYATREGVARRALLSLPSRQGCDAPQTRRAATCCPLGRHGSASGPDLIEVGRGTRPTRCTCSPGRDALP
jgi:hypothetical protein